MKTWQTVLFDLDGTLTDSKPGITRGVQYALDQFDIKVDNLDDLEVYIGPPLLDSFMNFHGLSEVQAQQALTHYRSYYTTRGIFEHSVYPGVPEMLRRLKEAGKILYVATSKPTPFARQMLEKDELDSFFSGIYGCFLDGRRTAKAAVIEAVLTEQGLDKGDTVMVGDREHDVIGAKAHELAVIGVLYGYGSEKELTDAGATEVVADVKALINRLEGK
ncbi:HAD family hydrolase [Anoxynatronum sibiricum]|uniref:HAD family hydrolase n=2 Tax=Anoxynatronum sibiricum TaxID=210623 RepID=A0ABU9VUX9_9CLOT